MVQQFVVYPYSSSFIPRALTVVNRPLALARPSSSLNITPVFVYARANISSSSKFGTAANPIQEPSRNRPLGYFSFDKPQIIKSNFHCNYFKCLRTVSCAVSLRRGKTLDENRRAFLTATFRRKEGDEEAYVETGKDQRRVVGWRVIGRGKGKREEFTAFEMGSGD
ncbi:hypothetical protein Trydic_g17019 [Trypoxylus dichotomus]